MHQSEMPTGKENNTVTEDDPDKTQKIHPSWEALKKVEKLAREAEHRYPPKDHKPKKGKKK